MKIIIDPAREMWKELLQRPQVETESVRERVEEVLKEVKECGDKAIKYLTKKFDGIELCELKVSDEEIANACKQVSVELKQAIQVAKKNIETFHSVQCFIEDRIETMPGVLCWRKSVGIEKVGIYIPGGSAALFSSLLMLAIPANLAGCKEIVVCTPPNKKGEVAASLLFAASILNISTIYKVGGAQAIAAMTYGTQTIPAVYKIFGPGNQYVTTAKMLVQAEGIAIDMPAGPSEVCVWADDEAYPDFVAADLLSQAEHGSDSQVMLVCDSKKFAKEVLKQMAIQINRLPRKDIVCQSLAHGKIIIVNNKNEALALINSYAPEHLIIARGSADVDAEEIINAGSVFLGHYSPESVGDYASGANHTLPTNGFAKSYSGLSVDSFCKRISYQKLTKEGMKNISRTVIAMAEEEGLLGHRNAVVIRSMTNSGNKRCQLQVPDID